MGDVYLAQHPRLPHWNALRVLSPTLTEDREFRDRFMRETPVATTLYHPHILEVEHRGETDGQLRISMDYVNGTTAAQLIANRFPTGMPAGFPTTVLVTAPGVSQLQLRPPNGLGSALAGVANPIQPGAAGNMR
jgi:serine/threonine protein kinase, bacterial